MEAIIGAATGAIPAEVEQDDDKQEMRWFWSLLEENNDSVYCFI